MMTNMIIFMQTGTRQNSKECYKYLLGRLIELIVFLMAHMEVICPG